MGYCFYNLFTTGQAYSDMARSSVDATGLFDPILLADVSICIFATASDRDQTFVVASITDFVGAPSVPFPISKFLLDFVHLLLCIADELA